MIVDCNRRRVSMSIIRADDMREPAFPKREGQSLRRLRAAALVMVVIGALGSIGFVFDVGRLNRSWFLLILFAVWVAAPFIGLVLAHVAANRLGVFSGGTLPLVMLAVAIVSLAIYGYIALGPPRPKPAFWFLIVPLVSWLFILIVAPVASAVCRHFVNRRIEPIASP
jgi:hypothetical protein